MPARRSRRIHRPVRPHPRPPRRTPTLRPAAHRHGDPMAPTELDQDAGTHLKGIAHDFSTHSVTVRTGNLQPERGLFWHPAPSTTDDQDVRVHHGFAGTGMRISPTEATTAVSTTSRHRTRSAPSFSTSAPCGPCPRPARDRAVSRRARNPSRPGARTPRPARSCACACAVLPPSPASSPCPGLDSASPPRTQAGRRSTVSSETPHSKCVNTCARGLRF